MKALIILSVMVTTLTFAACNSNNSNETATKTGTTGTKASESIGVAKTGTVNDILNGYLALKNALASDNANEAAGAAVAIAESLDKLNDTTLNPEQKQTYDKLKADIKDNAEHIKGSAAEIAHQREHFDILSAEIIALVDAVGTSQTLYKAYCPMYNNKNGAYWLSETKEVKNPYYGKEMLTCGEVREEIKPRS